MQLFNNLKAVGFSIESLEQLKDLEIFAAKNADYVSGDKGAYLHYRTSEGSEIWSQVGSSGEILGSRPFYNGKSCYPVLIQSVIPDPSGLLLDGALMVYPLKSAESSQFMIHIPDFALKVERLALPVAAEMQITGFAQKLYSYNSMEEFSASRHRGLDPQGAIVKKDTLKLKGEKAPAQPLAIVSGKVANIKKLKNSFSGKTFYAMQLTVAGGNIDVVFDKSVTSELPQLDAIVVGELFLSGRVISNKRRSEMISGVDAKHFSTMSAVREQYEKYISSEKYLKKLALVTPRPVKPLLLATLCMLTIVGIPFGLLLLRRAERDYKNLIQKKLGAELRFARVAVPLMCYPIKKLIVTEPHFRQVPFLVIGSFSDVDDEKLFKLIERLKSVTEEMTEEENDFVKTFTTIETYKEDRRLKIPDSMTEGKEIFIFDVMLRLPKILEKEQQTEVQQREMVVCIATEGKQGKIRFIPKKVIKEITAIRAGC